MQDTKKFYQSKGVMGGVAGAVIALIEIINILSDMQVTTDEESLLAMSITTLLTAIVSAYGRYMATKEIK